MKPLVALLVVGLALTAQAVSAQVAGPVRPVVLVFETNKGEGADRDLAVSATRALRGYLRDTERVEATLFDRNSASVLRAIMENLLTADQVASYSSREERLKVAKVLSCQYAAGSEVSVKDGVVQLKLWVGKVDGGRNASWESTGGGRALSGDFLDLDNAMQSAASAAVIDVARRAFVDLPRVVQPSPETGEESTAISAEAPPSGGQPGAGEIAAQAEESLKSGNVALAIQQYSQAVNADPSRADLRLRLAEAYALKGLYDQAYAEVGGATMIGATEQQIATAKARIAAIEAESGGAETPAEPDRGDQPSEPPRGSQDTPPLPPPAERPANARAAAIAKMIEGDKLWGKGNPDEAALAYKESIRLNPNDWRAYERLAVVSASMSLFAESRKALQQLNVVQPEPPADVLANRYEMLRKAFDKHFAALLRQYDSDAAAFRNRTLTHESYYTSTTGYGMRTEAMAQFLDLVTAPDAKQAVHLRRGLACGLVAQAAASLLEFLETNSAAAKANADVFITQAKQEFEAVGRLETSRVVVAEGE